MHKTKPTKPIELAEAKSLGKNVLPFCMFFLSHVNVTAAVFDVSDVCLSVWESLRPRWTPRAGARRFPGGTDLRWFALPGLNSQQISGGITFIMVYHLVLRDHRMPRRRESNCQSCFTHAKVNLRSFQNAADGS